MIPSLPEVSISPGSIPPGGAASGLLLQPGAALRGGDAGLGFAGLLNAALPEGETAAVALINQPAQVAAFGYQSRGATEAAPPPAVLVPAPAAPAASAASAPPPSGIRLPTGTSLPDSGQIVPPSAQPDASAEIASDLAETPATPVIAVQLRADTSGGPNTPSVPHSQSDSDATDEAPIETAAPAPTPAPVAAVNVTPVVLAAAPPAAPPPPSTPARVANRSDEPRAAPPLRAENRSLPASISLPEAESDTAATPTHSAPNPSEPQQPVPAPANTPQPAPITPGLAPHPIAAPAMAERAEPRAPFADQESAIAAVGEIREALRAVRPEMTLRHAEFGQVSLRIEPTGTQDWRAVLASRDPGFVPAIQAALAERAVAATADTASASNNPGQNSASDQRYGASPNGGQGSSQPYLGHSANRDEGQSSQSQNRQPSTTDAVAWQAGDAEAERPDRSERGVFA